jgi:capsular exopolysaccharide synthesis family protein
MAQENQEIDIRAWILRILKNWYWFVLSCAIFGAIGAYKYVTTPKKYRVDASIMIRNNDEILPQMEIMSMIGVDGGKMTIDEVELLTSRDLMTKVIRDLDLQTEYRKMDEMKWLGQYPKHDLTVVYPANYLDTLKKGVNIEIKVRKNDYIVKVKYGRWTRSRHKVKDLTEPFATCAGTLRFAINHPQEIEVGDRYRMLTLPMLPLVDMYKKQIEAVPLKKESNVISIATATDMPSRARDFIRKEIEYYNLDAVEDKNLMASNTAEFVDERLRLIEDELAIAEAEVERYKKKNNIVSLTEEAELLVKETLEYGKRIAEIETQLNLVKFVNEFVAEEDKRGTLIPSNIGIVDESLVTLITQYNELLLKRMRVQRTATSENPIINQLDSQLEVLRENIIVSIGNVRSSLNISKKDLEDQYAIAEKQSKNIPTQEREYIEVARNRKLKEELYLFLYKQREENALTLASAVMPAKVIASPQMNPTPVGPRLKLIALVCLFFGILTPLVIMLIADIMNNNVSDDSKELEKRLKIPFAGVLVKNHRGEHIAVREGENSVSAELFRTLRTNIRFMQPVTEPCPVMLVTSSINGEGKSYVATNLAISMALLGKKVALVGLDIRKPMLANYLNLPSQGCLTSYLSDDAYALEDTILASTVKNLDIIPAGIIPPNPSELLQSDRLDMFFQELRKRYDYVVVDSAPVAMVSDTFLLNRIADMTIYVTRANYTTFDLIDFLNQTHEQQRLPKMVAVLNGANAKKIGFGYGYGYGQDVKSGKR